MFQRSTVAAARRVAFNPAIKRSFTTSFIRRMFPIGLAIPETRAAQLTLLPRRCSTNPGQRL